MRTLRRSGHLMAAKASRTIYPATRADRQLDRARFQNIFAQFPKTTIFLRRFERRSGVGKRILATVGNGVAAFKS